MAALPARHQWDEIPPPPPARPVPLVVPWLIAVIPLIGQFERLDYPRMRIVAIAAAAAAVLAAARRWPLALVPAAALASVALVPFFGLSLAAHVAPLLLVPLVIWALALGALPDPPLRLPSGAMLYPALVPLGPAAVSLLRFTAFRFAFLCLGASLVLAGLAWVLPELARRVGEAMHRTLLPVNRGLAVFGRGLGRVVGVLVMVPGGVIVVLAWLGQRIVGYDPLAPQGRQAGTSWVRRGGGDPAPAQLFSGARSQERPPLAVALRRVGAWVVSLAIVAGVVVTGAMTFGPFDDVTDIVTGRPVCGSAPPDQAMDQDPNWDELSCEIMKFESQGRFDGTTTYTMADFDGDYVNVRDGVRESWHPPACDCKRVKVWLFGGSAAFGWWQRDDHTVASQLAKEAWKHGIALDIEVRAMPGWVAGQEVRRFAELAVGDEQPDIALFYDGGNDISMQKNRNALGRGADESATSFAEEEINRLLVQGPFPWTAADFVALPPDDPGPTLGPRAVADHAMARYARDLELARRVAEASDIEPIFVWQPLLPSAPRRTGNTDALIGEEDVFWRSMTKAAVAQLPDDVIDLSDALDDVDRVVFKDVWHTNEHGSAVVAEQLFEEIRPQLERAAR